MAQKVFAAIAKQKGGSLPPAKAAVAGAAPPFAKKTKVMKKLAALKDPIER